MEEDRRARAPDRPGLVEGLAAVAMSAAVPGCGGGSGQGQPQGQGHRLKIGAAMKTQGSASRSG